MRGINHDRIIAYKYDADSHCGDCAKLRHINRNAGSPLNPDSESYNPALVDSNWIPYEAVDSEGNKIHPVFSTDETPASIPLEEGGNDFACGDCLEIIDYHYSRSL